VVAWSSIPAQHYSRIDLVLKIVCRPHQIGFALLEQQDDPFGAINSVKPALAVVVHLDKVIDSKVWISKAVDRFPKTADDVVNDQAVIADLSSLEELQSTIGRGDIQL